MLSAFKNFFVTFLIAALVFGTCAYFATRFLTDTITGIFDVEANELNEILSASTDTGSPDPSVTTPPIGSETSPNPEDEVEGSSFNMLFIVTDYQPDIFNDYLPDADTLTAMENDPDALTGILGADYRRPRACAVFLMRADLERREYTLTSFPSITRVETAAGDCSLADLYNYSGRDAIISEISALTGMTIDHYLLVNITELSDIVRELGGFNMYLSQELYYNGRISTTIKPSEEEASTLPLLYSIGTNYIDGSGAMAIMMNEEYASGVTGRNTLLVNFFTALMNRMIEKSEAELTAFYDSICEDGLVETTFTPKDLVAQIELIYAFGRSDFRVSTLDYPGRFVAATETEKAYFEPNTKTGLTLFKTYRPYESANTASN